MTIQTALKDSCVILTCDATRASQVACTKNGGWVLLFEGDYRECLSWAVDHDLLAFGALVMCWVCE